MILPWDHKKRIFSHLAYVKGLHSPVAPKVLPGIFRFLGSDKHFTLGRPFACQMHSWAGVLACTLPLCSPPPCPENVMSPFPVFLDSRSDWWKSQTGFATGPDLHGPWACHPSKHCHRGSVPWGRCYPFSKGCPFCAGRSRTNRSCLGPSPPSPSHQVLFLSFSRLCGWLSQIYLRQSAEIMSWCEYTLCLKCNHHSLPPHPIPELTEAVPGFYSPSWVFVTAHCTVGWSRRVRTITWAL